MNVLITGAAGFTARHLVARLRLEQNLFLVGTDTLRDAPQSVPLNSYFSADLTDSRQAIQLIQKTKPDWIFNLAGMARGSAPDLYRINLVAAVNLLEAVRTEAANAAVLLVGSAAEYGIWPREEMPLAEDYECRPVGTYGLSKYAMTLAAQDYARNHGLKVTVVRPFNLIGAGMPTNLIAGAVAQRIKTALTNGDSTIPIGNADTQRDFIAIEDAVDAYVKLLQAGRWGEVFNICSGRPHSVQEIIETLLSFAPRPISVIEDEALKRPNDPPLVIGDATKANRAFGFSPQIGLHDSLRAAWESIVDSPMTTAASPLGLTLTGRDFPP